MIGLGCTISQAIHGENLNIMDITNSFRTGVLERYRKKKQLLLQKLYFRQSKQPYSL